MSDGCNEKDIDFNKIKVLSNYSNKGNLVCFIKGTADDKILCACNECEHPSWIKAQSLYRSLNLSWHKTYRCNKCVNKGRCYTYQHRKNIAIGNTGKKFSEKRKKNIGASVIKSYSENHGWVRKFYYKDHVFKSSYELRFAIILDRLGIDWEYESFTFYIPEINKHYCPDFYLPRLDLFVEVKGFWRDDAQAKFNLVKNKLNNKLKLVDRKELIRIENEQRL